MKIEIKMNDRPFRIYTKKNWIDEMWIKIIIYVIRSDYCIYSESKICPLQALKGAKYTGESE